MCGIAGILVHGKDESLRQSMARMLQVMAHRGPDDRGIWESRIEDQAISLGNNRLAILDLTPAGHQPMISASGQNVLVFNGEIYNFREIRDELERAGVQFHSRCDTEVVLQALIRWGQAAFEKFNGMWALGYLDIEGRKFILSRDRFGIKPLYLFRHNQKIFFASEIKAILEGTKERFPINPEVAGRYLGQFLLNAQSQTFFSKIEALPPGHFMEIDLNAPLDQTPKVKPYWKIPDGDPYSGSLDALIEKVRELFIDSVRLRLRSDVPVGVLLSGGVDSSSIAGAMQTVLGKESDLRILSAVSNDPRISEEPFVDCLAQHLGVGAHKIYMRADEEKMFEYMEKATWFNDEPIGGVSSVVHYMLMEEAKRQGVTVILSGQGADEILCGYRKYLFFYVHFLAKTRGWASALKVLVEFYGSGVLLSQFSLRDAKRYMLKKISSGENDILGPALRERNFYMDIGLGDGHFVDRQLADVYRFSVPGLVHYEDRMSMAHSTEIRLPFLDFRLVSLLLPLDPRLKLKDGYTKWVFRKAMESYLPHKIAWRKDKQGFITPEEGWLKGPARKKIDSLFREGLVLSEMGLVNQKAFEQRYNRYCKQPHDKGIISENEMFSPIAMEIWVRKYRNYLQV